MIPMPDLRFDLTTDLRDDLMFDSIRHRDFIPQVALLSRTSRLNRVSVPKSLLACAFLAASLLPAQTQPAPAAPSTSPASQVQPALTQSGSTPHHRRKHPAATPAAPQAAPATPPAPEWPINDRPVPATVTWNRNALRIDATNSSLEQILTDVATDTGSTVEGVSKDERVFGSFGPAPAREVLSQLLQGSGYNVVMVGDQGQGVPRQIILSARNSIKAPQGAARPNQEDTEDDTPDYPQPQPQYDPQPQQPVAQPVRPMRQGFPPDSAPNQMPQQIPQQQQPQPGQQPNTPPNNEQ
jgi:hypothetical protein